MSDERIGIYEGLFLFPQSATANLQGAVDHIKGILEKAGATIKTFSKWDDRRLAYEIDGNKRGVYFLAYFNAPASAMSIIERQCNQSEDVLRTMITKADHIPSDTIDANEGSQELAVEIKVRSEKTSEASRSSSSKISKKESQEPTKDAEPVDGTDGKDKLKETPKATEPAEDDATTKVDKSDPTTSEEDPPSEDKKPAERVAKETAEETTEADESDATTSEEAPPSDDKKPTERVAKETT